MKSVVFSGSVRTYAAMEAWADILRAKGITVKLPSVTIKPEDFKMLDVATQRRRKLDFITDHNRRIDASDVLLVFNPDGYVGNSVTLEIGYALAKGKLIYAAVADTETGRDVVYAGYCSAPEELIAILAA
jgi:nucleoside 2-deoxyribosyltransferase